MRLGLLSIGLLACCQVCAAQVFPATRPATPDPNIPTPPIAASSAVLIVDAPTDLPAADAEAALTRRINNHIATLRSEQNIRSMFRSAESPVRKTQWFITTGDPSERGKWLAEHLHVARIAGTSLVELSLPELPLDERKTLLSELGNTYIERTRKEQFDAVLDRTAVLNNIKVKAEMRLKDLTADMKEKQIRLNLDGGGVNRLGVKELELSRLVGELVSAQVAASQTRNEFERISDLVNNGKEVPGVDAVINADARLNTWYSRLDEVEIRLDVQQEKALEKDPLIADLKAELKSLKKHIESRKAELVAQAKVNILQTLHSKSEQAMLTLENLNKRVENLKQDIGELSNAATTYFNLQDEQKGLIEQIKSVKAQIERVMSEQHSQYATGIHWHVYPQAAFESDR